MSMDLTGITNKNEYYTNHYFSTVFEENTRATISGWNAAARESEEIKTPWSLLRQNARQYYTAHDKFVRSSVNLQVLANIKALVGNYLKSLGYPEAKPEVVAVDDSLSVPVYLEMTKSNGAPLLWVLLSASKESDAGIMESFVFNANDVDDDAAGTLYKGVLGEIANEDLVTKILFGTAEPPRFVMLIGMNQIALIDRNKWNEKRYLQFELEEIFSRLENTTLQAMSVLLHKDSLCPDDGKVLLDELDEQSQKNASGVSQDLKYALRESIELLGNEVLYDMKARLGRDLDADPVDAGQLTLECLRYMYRMLFVLFIESRPELGYAPIKAQSYYSGYSLESLRDIADNIRDDVNEVGDGYYLHETLAKLYELIYDGYPKTEDELKKATGSDSLHDMFLIAPLKAHIFDPEYTKMITAAKLRTLREINFGESDMTGEKLSVSGVEEVRKGFRICKYCGKIQPENGKANHSFACKTRKMPALMQANAYEECLFLYREFSTEILRLLVPATTMDSSSVKMESFVAAFMLGMKEYFGNVDHLRATVSEVPVPDADYRKQYLVIYDSVPGGTGYLKQLMHEKNALIEIFERALHVMENCSCKDDPQKDGCYHCLYAYRQSQQIGNISRTTAIRILKSILSGKDNVQKIDKINDIPVNPLFDSELEQRFMEAIRTKVGAANVSDTIRNGKHSYYVKIENFAWEIEPQVPLDAGSGVSVDCKPDFVFWPVSAPEHKPVAVFTDGFLYHKDIVSDDTIKREAIRRSGNFRVWSLSFKDVQSVFAPQGDFYTTTLEAEKMPSGKTMYQNMIKKQKADVIEPARLSSFDLLLEYLKLPDAERVFKGQAYAYSLSLLEPALMKNNLAFNNWEMIVKAVNDQTHFTNADFVFLGTIFGSWIPRTSNAHLAIHSAILASELKAGGAVAVCAVLNDEKDRRTDKYEQEWNGLWRFYNVMQFSDEFIAVSSVGMSHMDYLALPVAINADSDTVAPVAAVDDAWNAIKELLFDDDAKAFVEIAKDAGVPAPDEDNIGYEVEGGDGEVVAAVEIAWPDRRIGFMTAEQAEDKEKLEKLGWRILNLLDAANMDVASYFGGDNQ